MCRFDYQHLYFYCLSLELCSRQDFTGFFQFLFFLNIALVTVKVLPFQGNTCSHVIMFCYLVF